MRWRDDRMGGACQSGPYAEVVAGKTVAVPITVLLKARTGGVGVDLGFEREPAAAKVAFPAPTWV